jgi:hypothetical protein
VDASAAAGAQEAARAPAEVAELAEILLAKLGADVGNWRLELFATDGNLRKWARHEEGGRDQLQRFDLVDSSPTV